MNTTMLKPSIKTLSLSILAAAIAAFCYPDCAFSQSRVTGYQTVGRDIAANSAVDVEVYPGRATAIDFSSTDEALAYVLIADPSKVVFSTDAQLASGQAKTVFLRPIQALNFPGVTTATITNLSIKTVDSKGKQRLYNFNIVPANKKPEHLGIRITPLTPRMSPTLNLARGRTPTASDVEKGLLIAIQKGYTAANDPVVYSVRQFLALVRNHNLSVTDAAARAGVDLSVIVELAKIAFEESNYRSHKPTHI
ncbi:hypothetical protein QUA54_05145 [Microcoleus sp. MOSTC5]|uniref:hypothetical protein n=1 Tax=Microcoleus sp. MOSTC5 TaxID=3055378 RepID=UPI002FCFCC40